jgi:hypothetical protein
VAVTAQLHPYRRRESVADRLEVDPSSWTVWRLG